MVSYNIFISDAVRGVSAWRIRVRSVYLIRASEDFR